MNDQEAEWLRRMAESEGGQPVSAGVWLGDVPYPPAEQVRAAEAFGKSFAAFLGTIDPLNRDRLLYVLYNSIVAEVEEIDLKVDQHSEEKSVREPAVNR